MTLVCVYAGWKNADLGRSEYSVRFADNASDDDIVEELVRRGEPGPSSTIDDPVEEKRSIALSVKLAREHNDGIGVQITYTRIIKIYALA
jgi:hypothetical protein